jgi:opacity protein-like surface antigen
MAVTDNLFLRAEWEYIKLLKVKDVGFSVNSARVGVGYRF